MLPGSNNPLDSDTIDGTFEGEFFYTVFVQDSLHVFPKVFNSYTQRAGFSLGHTLFGKDFRQRSGLGDHATTFPVRCPHGFPNNKLFDLLRFTLSHVLQIQGQQMPTNTRELVAGKRVEKNATDGDDEPKDEDDEDDDPDDDDDDDDDTATSTATATTLTKTTTTTTT